MLCNVTPLNSIFISIINNAKPISRFDKFTFFEKQEYSYLNKFIKDLDLSEETVKIVEKSLNQFHLVTHGNNHIFDRRSVNTIGVLLRRNFHTKKSHLYQNNEEKDSKSFIDKSSKIELRDILNRYNSKPMIQQSINEAYRIASENALNLLMNDRNKERRITFLRYFVYFFVFCLASYLMSDIGKNIGSVNNTGGIAKMFSKSWTQSGASLVTKVEVKFDDVQGCDEVKKELQDVVHFLRNPSLFAEIGAKLPKGVLLIGQPGIGKTLLARAVAGEAGVPFLYVSGSQFDEMFVGVGASRVRALFNEAKEHSPCVVFIDELDAVCGERTSSPSHPYANQTINQLLSEMDGFVENEGIIVIGATNRVKALDKAVLRPGRFDLKVEVHQPDYRGRLALFDLYLTKVIADDSIDIPNLARATSGYTGADIKNMVNQAAIICVLKEEQSVTMNHLWEAQAKTLLGAARSRPLQESENRLTAFHEAGHSIVTYFAPNSSNKIKMVTILPRGNSGGHNSLVPKVETNNRTKAELKAIIDGFMGGRAAEELLSGDENISIGISSDMAKASEIARQMVKNFTMSSEEVGFQVYESDHCKCGGSSKSPKVSDAIDTEVNKILKESYCRAKVILQEHNNEWHALANNLLKYETLDGDDVELIINGKTPKVALTVEASIEKIKKPSTFSDSTKRLLNIFTPKDIKK